jgi:hypothetical protein
MESYARYEQYIFSRYGAYNLILSGIHLDAVGEHANADTFNLALTRHYEKYGPPPFGQPVTTLIAITTFVQFGHGEDCPWLSMHTAGNQKARNHGISPYMVEMFHLDSPYPVANLEPYYTGWEGKDNKPAGEDPPINSPRDNYFSRASMYGSVLSGGLAGHVHGHNGYDCVVSGEPPGQHPYVWEALQYPSNFYMQHLKKFILSEGARYQELEPAFQDLSPQKAKGSHQEGLDGWSFMMRTPDKGFALLYFENKAKLPVLSGMLPSSDYTLFWYDPVSGEWSGTTTLRTDKKGKLVLPGMPDPHKDWAAKLISSL